MAQFTTFSASALNDLMAAFKTNNRCIEIQLMRKLLSDHFVSSASLPNEFEQHFLPMFSHPFVDSIESIIDIVKLGPKLMYAAVSSNLLDIEWKRLDSEVRLPRFSQG